jgi:hypothetical protein
MAFGEMLGTHAQGIRLPLRSRRKQVAHQSLFDFGRPVTAIRRGNFEDLTYFSLHISPRPLLLPRLSHGSVQ